MKIYDAVIIGFGKAGKTLAADLAAQGKSVAIIEKSDKMYGGTCPNTGCIPTKFLVLAGQQSQHLQKKEPQSAAEIYRQAIQDKNNLTAKLRNNMYNKLTKSGVDVITGLASFSGPKTLMVRTTAENLELSADKIFINTGAEPFLPPIPGIDGPHIYTSETLMELTEYPKNLVIIGGGFIGLEFASIYASFGSIVTVLQDQPTFLPREDTEIAAEILKDLTARGIEFHFGVKVNTFSEDADKTVIKFTSETGHEQELCADAVLISTGRRPQVKELNPEAAGIRLTSQGAIEVNQHLQTSNPDIFAMGDVKGGLQFTYISLDDYRIVKSFLEGDKSYTADQRGEIPYAVFLTPPYSRVGMNETEAKQAGKKIKIGCLAVPSLPRAKVLGETRGIFKAVVDAETDLILGAMLYGPESFELINMIKLAMDNGLPYQVLRDTIYTHPAMSEAFNDLFTNLK